MLSLDNKPVAAKFLDRSTLQPVIQIDREGIVVALPSEMPNRHASVVKLTLDGPAKAREGSGGVRTEAGKPVKAKDGKVSLLPEDATLTNGLMTESKDEEKMNIGGWTNESASATWNFSAPKGTYQVALEVANPGAGNTLILNFGGKKIVKVAVPSTGDWAKFKRVDAGQVELTENTTLKVTCEKIVGEGAANVRLIQLEKR